MCRMTGSHNVTQATFLRTRQEDSANPALRAELEALPDEQVLYSEVEILPF